YYIEVLAGTTLDLSDVNVPGTVSNGTVIFAATGATSVFVYNSSATPTGNLYSSWSALVAALGVASGPKVVQFEQDETIPAGAWDLNDSSFHG
ncbi:hypothetical protein ABK046_45985, partial [Streptomyces caeruleatus]